MMGAHVLELSRLHDVRKVVIAGTVCAYPKLTPVPFREDDLWHGYPEETNAPYGVAKKSVLVGAQAYREQYGTDAVFLLPANLYGPRDNFDLETSHVIPALIRKMTEAESEVVLWGDGSPTREFLYVDDCAEGFMLAGERYDGSEPVNLGTGVETSIRELGRDDRRPDRVHGRDRVGHLDAERPAAPAARRLAGRGAVRLPRARRRCATASHARSRGTARTASRMRIPDSPRRALARFGHLAVRPVPLLLTLAARRARDRRLARIRRRPTTAGSGTAAATQTEYWTAQWAVAHGFVPQAVISLRAAGLLRLGAARHRHHAPPRLAGDRAAAGADSRAARRSSSSGRSPTSSTAVPTRRSRRRSGRSGRSDDARGRRPLPPVVRAVLPRAALGGSDQHGRPAVGRARARDDVGGARARSTPDASTGRSSRARSRGSRSGSSRRTRSSSPALVVLFAAALRPRLALACAAGLAPALLTLIVWKSKGLGHLPITSAYAATREAAAGPVAVARRTTCRSTSTT